MASDETSKLEWTKIGTKKDKTKPAKTSILSLSKGESEDAALKRWVGLGWNVGKIPHHFAEIKGVKQAHTGTKEKCAYCTKVNKLKLNDQKTKGDSNGKTDTKKDKARAKTS